MSVRSATAPAVTAALTLALTLLLLTSASTLAGASAAAAAPARFSGAVPGPAAAPAPAPAPTSTGGSAGWTPPVGPVSVVHGFDLPSDPYGPGHRGVDLLAPAGGLVRATADGVVTFAGFVAGQGVVTVSHGGLRSTYEPVIATVHAGDHVRAGDPLGRLSTGPGHCGLQTCLHLGVRVGKVYLDPLTFLGHPRIRLLPVWGVPPPTWADRLLAVARSAADGGMPRVTRRGRPARRPAPAPTRPSATAASHASSSPGAQPAAVAAGLAGLGGLGAVAARAAARRRRSAGGAQPR